MKDLPIQTVEDPFFRSFSKHNKERISVKTLREVMFHLVELVEKKISDELRSAKTGAIMHDGWTHHSVHFCGVFASYMLEPTEKNSQGKMPAQKKKKKEDLGPIAKLTLLAVSPLPHVSVHEEECSGEDEDEAVEFTAEAHVQFFKDTFSFYAIENIYSWLVASIADNAKVNLKVARLLKVAHIGCKSHLLNLDVEAWVDSDVSLSSTLDSVHSTMKAAKAKLKNAAILRNLTHLKPVLYNKTRWSGKSAVLERFVRIREQLIQAADNESASAEIPIERSASFRDKAAKYGEQMKRINQYSVLLQEREKTLADCDECLEDLDALIAEHNDPDKEGGALKGCNYRRVKSLITPSNSLCISAHFESGVIKLQQKKVDALDTLEKHALRPLERMQSIDAVEEASANTNQAGRSPTAKERLQKRKAARVHGILTTDSNRYINVDFIRGSAAEVERLWSAAKRILTDTRSRTTPRLFEAILYLKFNKDYWGQYEVNIAIINAREHMATERQKDNEAYEAVNNQDHEEQVNEQGE